MSDIIDMPLDVKFNRISNLGRRIEDVLLSMMCANMTRGGSEFTLSNGIKGKFVQVGEIKDGSVMIDARLENYELDHIEFNIERTGGGYSV